MGPALSADDLYRFRWVDHVRLSPAADRVAYQLTWADAQSRENAGRVYVRGLGPGERSIEIASPARRDHSPEWSADGRRLALVGRLGARDQLLVAEPAGAPARPLTSLADGVASPAWSPDGRWIAFLGTVVGDPGGVVDDPRSPDSPEQPRRPPVARVVRDFDYKHNSVGYADGRRKHLFVVDPESAEPVQLTEGPWNVEAFAWAPDSSRLALAGDPEPGADLRYGTNLYEVDLAGHLRLLVRDMELATPTWSPRGDLIAFLAPLVAGAGAHERVWVVTAAGGRPSCLTGGLDRSAAGSVINDMRAAHGGRLAWNAAGDRINFLASGPGVCELLSVGTAGDVRLEAGGERNIYDFDTAQNRFALAAAEPSHPGELRLLDGGGEVPLSDLNPWLRERYVALPERHLFTAQDGWEIEGWLLKPEGFDPARQHPLVLQIHGGPHGQYGYTFFHEFQLLAGQGYLVFYTNPRGSDGKSEAFKQSCVRDWGGADYGDLMAALDQLIARTGFVDEKRLGIAGGSYGGFMTNWAIGHTQRFGAAVSMRSITNLVSEYCQHDIVLWGMREMGPAPWPDPEELWQRSPIRYVREMTTPLLLLHGEMDLRCAISQAEELFGALRLLGRRVELVRFPGESHDLSRSGRPDRRVERLNRISDWFERHLLRKDASLATAAAD